MLNKYREKTQQLQLLQPKIMQCAICVKYFSYIIPSTPGVTGFLYIRQMGADITDVMPKYINLWIQVAVYTVTAVLAIRWQQKQRQFII